MASPTTNRNVICTRCKTKRTNVAFEIDANEYVCKRCLNKDKENKVINCNIMKTKEKLKKYDGITINRKNCKK